MTPTAIELEFKNLVQLPRMDSSKKPSVVRKSFTLQERLQALRQKCFSEKITNIQCTDIKEPESNQQVPRGRETGLTKSELITKKTKRKLSPVDDRKKSTSTKNTDGLPAKRPPCSPKKKAITATGAPIRKLKTNTANRTREHTPKPKTYNSIVKSPPSRSPKGSSLILRSQTERKSKTPIADRVNKFREKLLSDASNKTDTTKPGSKRALNLAGPSTPEPISNKNNFKIPKIGGKEKLSKMPPGGKSAPQTDNYSEVAMDIDWSLGSSTAEEMDWEINEVRRELRDPLFTREANYSVDPIKPLTFDGQWIIAIDTNVFISDLSFVQELRDTDVVGLGFPVIYVPHRVLCELDALKDRPQSKSESVARSARKAVTYLNSCLVEKHPRVKGQSISDYIAMKDLVDMGADDKILLSCLQLKKTHPNKLLVFLSNDTNLRNKALIEDIETFSVDTFQKHFLSGQDDDPAKMNRIRLESRLKNTIKIVLTEILEAELKTKFRKLANLDDALDFFIQKWGCYFSSSLPVPAEEELQKMRSTLQQEEKGRPLSLVSLMDAATLFITHFYVKGKKYFTSVEKALKVFKNLRPIALDFDKEPEEKHVTGAMEAVLRSAWEKMYLESDAINTAKEACDPSHELRERHLLNTLSHLIEVLSKVMDTSLFDVSTSPAIGELAATLASCTDDDTERIFNLLVRVCTTIDGRNMIANAFKIFQAAYNNCNAEHT